ncbi:MAG: alpha/beta hydrolase [Motiliproteus sp.]
METLISHDQTPIRYVSLGHGRPLIFLHGWTASVREWLPFAAPLSEQFRTLCWDARGHGDHRYNSDIDMGIGAMAADLHQLITELKLDKPVLIGHSMGALTSWEYIRHYGSDHLGGLCIIDQSPKLITDSNWQHGIYSDFDSNSNQHLIGRLGEDFAEGVLELAANGNNPRITENYQRNSRGFQKLRLTLQQLPADLLIRAWKSLSTQDYRDVLSQINIPCLQIYGDQSQFYSQDLAHWVACQLNNTQLQFYPNSDHSPHLWHQQQFIYDLNQFCQQLEHLDPRSQAPVT